MGHRGRGRVLALVLVALCSWSACGDSPPVPSRARGFDFGKLKRQVHFAFRPQGDGFVGGDSGYEVRANGHGFTLTPRRGDPVTITTVAVAAARSPSPPMVDEDGSLIRSFGRGTVERLRNRPDGVEQSWEFDARPTAGNLTVRVRLEGRPYVGKTAGGLHFSAPATGAGVRYGTATWIDARGNRTEISPQWADGVATLTVPAATIWASAFPATLDPIIGPEFEMDDPVPSPAPDGNSQAEAVAAFDGTNFLVVWSDNRGGVDEDIFGARIDSSGTSLDPSGIVIANDSGNENAPRIAFDGTNYLVVWERHTTSFDYVGYRRVSTGGDLLDTAGSIGAGAKGPSVAFGAGIYLLVYNTNFQIRGLFRNTDGTASGGSFIISEPPPCSGFECFCFDLAYGADVAFNGTNFLVAGVQYQNDECLGEVAYLFARRVTPTGAILDTPDEIFVATYPPIAVIRPRVATDGDGWFVVYDGGPGGTRSVFGRRVGSAGTLSGTVTVMDTPDDQADPVIAWDGHQYAVSWVDYRDDPDGDIWTTWVSSTGTVLDPAGVELSSPGTQDSNPGLVGADPGRALLTYERNEVGIATTRVKGRFLSWSELAPDGAPCTDGTTCTSSYCVDGVCCDTSCGDSSTTDCQACSTSAGGTADGVCAPVLATHVCRPAAELGASSCDAPETCDGVGTSCPDDESQPNGTACDDGDPCTAAEQCNDGVCGGGRSAITVAPPAVAFPDTSVGEQNASNLTIVNTGAESLTLEYLSTSNPTVFPVVVDPSPVSLAPEGSVGATIGFAPTAAVDYGGTLSLATDRCAPVLTSLEGLGADTPMPPDGGGSGDDADGDDSDDGGCSCRAVGSGTRLGSVIIVIGFWSIVLWARRRAFNQPGILTDCTKCVYSRRRAVPDDHGGDGLRVAAVLEDPSCGFSPQ